MLPRLRADLNVIDFERLACEPPVMAYDLPAGGKRLLQGARGYCATVVAGEITYRDGEPRGALPGRLVRGGRDAAKAPRSREPLHRTPRGADMMASELHELEPAAEWRAGDIADVASWTLQLSAADHAELHAALTTAKKKSADPLELERDDFPLDRLATKLSGIVDTLLNGRGFAGSPRSTPRATTMAISHSSTGVSACISASPGRRTSTATCWVT